MSDSIEQKLKENEELQAFFHKNALHLEELHHKKISLLQRRRELDEAYLPLLRDSEYLSEFLAKRIEIEQEEIKERTLHNQVFDRIVADLERLESQHIILEKMLQAEQNRKENQPNGQNGDQ